MKKYEVTFEDFDHDRCVIEIEAESKEEALMEVESELEQCYSALFAEVITHNEFFSIFRFR